MRWFQAGVVVLSVMAMTGCPSEFGKDGRIGKAVRKDARDQLGITGCSEARSKEVSECPNRTDSKFQECGG
jgi:hypothetical protein